MTSCECFSTAHIAGSWLECQSKIRNRYNQVPQRAGVVLHILHVPSWCSCQAVEGFSTLFIAGSKLVSRKFWKEPELILMVR